MTGLQLLPLPEPTVRDFEALAANCIRSRLTAHGPAPWSLCEAGLGEEDYQRLCRWAESVTAPRLKDESGCAGLVLLTFVSEWNRRNSRGGTVWVGLAQLFADRTSRRRLFTVDEHPTQFMYRSVYDTCERFRLRHVFGQEADETERYYLSIQLQYGFSLPHAREQLGKWLHGHEQPKVSRHLLEADGSYRSASFRRLVRDMKSYRRNYLPESDFRRTLRENPWVLPAWENEIISLVNEIPQDTEEDEPEFQLLSDPRITWEDGPEAWCRVHALPDRLTAPRYVLRHAGGDLAYYYRNRSGQIEADRDAVQIPLDGPEVVVTLENPDGVIVEVQTLHLWNPDLVAQVRRLGREADEAAQRLLPGEQVLITSGDASVTPAPCAWHIFNSQKRRWRWSLIDGAERVRVEDNGTVWDGEPPPPPPSWANGVSVRTEPARGPFRLRDPVRFRIVAPAGVEIAHARCAGESLSFSDPTRTRSYAVPVRAEMHGQCRVRVGVVRGPDSAIAPCEVSLSVRAVTWADNGVEIPQNEPVSCFEIMNRPIRLINDASAVLIEGREVVSALPMDRAARVRRVLGTGKELRIADSPINTDAHFLLARSAMDTGFAGSLERLEHGYRMRLFRSVPPGERHQLFLWSPEHGTTILGKPEVTSEDADRSWTFPAPWRPETMLAAVKYEGRCVAAAWCGREELYFDPNASDGMDVITRIALVRWCRLPGLRPDPEAQKQPLIRRLACFPLEMVRVALLDDGLPADRDFVFEDRQSPRGELFNAVFREAYFAPASNEIGQIFDKLPPNDFHRLLTFHPLLSCRVLQSVLPRLTAQSRATTRILLAAMQRQLLSLAGNPSSYDIARREEELLNRARGTFAENGKPLDEYAVRQGLIRPVMRRLFDGDAMDAGQEDNLRTALGVGSFRECLAAMILRRLFERITD